MSGTIVLSDMIRTLMTERYFLRKIGMSSSEMTEFLGDEELLKMSERILDSADERGRFRCFLIAENAESFLVRLLEDGAGTLKEGWTVHSYKYVLGELFPEKKEYDDEYLKLYAKSRMFFLQLLKAVFRYEKTAAEFDPTYDIVLVERDVIEKNEYNEEYLRFLDITEKAYIYEFMRMGIEITPFNTLGHIAGVHYTAMHAARQLAALGVPVDLGLISGAAYGHDVGKYGCKKSEEKRIPYLHYYYTDMCFRRYGMHMIGHIAANHSTWDLELENLSVESLLLIYADFRVKSSRKDDGGEEVHFYTLAEAFDVILKKLDNVDEAKRHRYCKVYNKLKDFESYMVSLGVDTKLPAKPAEVPCNPEPAESLSAALLSADDTVEHLKFAAIDHNINLMNIFYSEEKFGSLLESARSEKEWKNLRTYISILGEYSTYMTEKQKLMTLRFLRELLLHRESDIRSQAADIIGRIVARFNEEYRKELPEGKDLPEKEVTNDFLWEAFLDEILQPDHKLTAQHKKWEEKSLQPMVAGLLENLPQVKRQRYIDMLLRWYKKEELTDLNKEALLLASLSVEPDMCTPQQLEEFNAYVDSMSCQQNTGLRVAAVTAKKHFSREEDEEKAVDEIKESVGLAAGSELTQEELSEMYLDNLKAGTPWPVKVANIQIMLHSLKNRREGELYGRALHVATHLGNLVKVSETVIVRKKAGEALISIIDFMPLEQRNEIAVELGKGLEIGDYQFSKYIPDYLGVIMLHLPPRELDELINDLEKFLEASNGQVAAAVMNTFGVLIENYKIYRQIMHDAESEEKTEERKYRIIGMIMRGAANYNNIISREALWTLGMHIFGSHKLSSEEKYDIYCHCGKKILTLYNSVREGKLDFFNNAAVLNQIYRFICEYELENGKFNIAQKEKVAFFPGTFDPFSLSHKAIASRIRDMGCEVYLALDEFSWSKKTQPRLQRRRIMSMSVADEEDIYIFPDDIPINIANPENIKRLQEIFRDRELYFVAGSDVIQNASCYKAEPCTNSIHHLNHVVFKRTLGGAQGDDITETEKKYLKGKVINLNLDEQFEHISSTRIRENIDMSLDISNLIDPVAQNYILENGLYLREPEYKHVVEAREIHLGEYGKRGGYVIDDMGDELTEQGYNVEKIREYLDRPDVRTVIIRDSLNDGKIAAAAAVSRLDSRDFLGVFGDQDTAAYVRSRAAGSIGVIGGLYFSRRSSIENLGQIILVEMLSELLARDYTYAVYFSCDKNPPLPQVVETLKKQGFVNIAPQDSLPIYAVDMHSPAIIFKNIEATIKNPLNKNRKVLKAVENAHDRLLDVLRDIYPGELILSYNSGIMHHKMIGIIAELNGVSPVPSAEKKYGPYMVVPFGKILDGVAVPNTVTKALHTEKYFAADVNSFTIEESSFYSTLENQVRTIKAFNRPVILVDDLVHKGYRMNKIDPILKNNDVHVVNTVVGVQTGRGRDLMSIKKRSVESAYFLPNMKCWIDESAVYAYIGGDSLKNPDVPVAATGRIPSMNLILPYAVPSFLGDIPGSDVYKYSMVCLENSRDILKALEEEYQNEFERKLTIRRLGEVINEPKRVDFGEYARFDENIAASDYVEKDIERLIRMKKMFK